MYEIIINKVHVLFKAACISILLYGCETWILTEALTEKLDIFARTCYRIMLGIKQSRDHVTNERLYQRVNQVPIREMIRERQLKFTGHCIRMPTYEPIKRFVLYESKVRPSLRSGAQTRTYRMMMMMMRTRKKYSCSSDRCVSMDQR